ncbi:MAG: ABC transporter substrate-binding protein [Balneolaceae bacterium]|nr:ABC transporter substrate-binding protein [Balneolaceae bacterium]
MQGSSLRYLQFFLLCVTIMLVSCSSETRQDPDAMPISRSNVTFDDSVRVEYASGFRIRYRDNYKLLEILNPYQDRTDTLRYVLKPRGLELDTTFRQAQVIDIPIRSMIATSTTHIALTEMLNANDIITGMVGAEYVYSSEIRNRLAEGKITGFSQGEFNKEQALAMQPDLIMVSAGQSSQFDDYRVLMESGINVLLNSEWLETTPLGKAEWVKMMAALLNRESVANDKFEAVAREYRELKQKAEGVAEKPLVINNLPYKGAWFVSGGDSFTAQYLKDAGAEYPWYDNASTGGLRKDFEVVYEVGLAADVWINPGAASSLGDILEKDSRFRDFRSFQNRRIYNNNKRMSESGGNDYWESGVVHPERLLADLIHIMHPEIQPDRELYYYQRLDGGGNEQ